MKLEKMQPGMTLYGVERRQMGNTTMRETVAIDYRVVEVSGDGAIVTRNGRRIRMNRRRVERLRGTNPTCRECRKVARHVSTCSKSKRRDVAAAE